MANLLVMEAKHHHRRYVPCQCSAHQKCLLSKIICIAPVVFQPASDFRIFFLRLTNGTIGPGLGFAHLSTLYQNARRRPRQLRVLAHHIFHTGALEMVPFN